MVKASAEAQYEVIDMPAGGPVKPPPLPTNLQSVQPLAGTKSTSTENVGSATPGYLNSNLSKEDIDKMGKDPDFGAGQTTVIPLPTTAKQAKKAKAEKKTKSKESNSREEASNPKQKACVIVSSVALVLCLAGAILSAVAIALEWNI
ncbi:hypothetical protein AAVH_05040 [Aphelenchoides avenae]|nr:hypothetical protein AAVH_05040 [Aphelenchus avenae]